MEVELGGGMEKAEVAAGTGVADWKSSKSSSSAGAVLDCRTLKPAAAGAFPFEGGASG